MLRKWFCLTAAAGMIASTGFSALGEEAKAPAKAKKEDAKLVKVTTLEDAFARSLKTRQQLANRVVVLVKALRAEKDDEKKKALREDLGKANQALQSVKVAMEVVFGIGNRREYAYVANTIYLKVGTVQETFARAVQTREALRKTIAQKTEAKAAAKDAETVQKLEKEIESATKRYQVIVASLQLVFGVVPQRNYTYNPKNATLYLNVTDEEVAKLKEKLAELKQKQDAPVEEKTDK